MYKSNFICTYLYMYTCASACTPAAHTSVHARMRVYVCMRIRMHVYAKNCTYDKHINTVIYICINVCIYKYVHAHLNIHTYIHTYIIHIYIHIHTPIRPHTTSRSTTISISISISLYIHTYIYTYMVTPPPPRPQDPQPFVLTVNLRYSPLFCDNQVLVVASRCCMIGKTQNTELFVNFTRTFKNAQFLILFIISTFMVLERWLWTI